MKRLGLAFCAALVLGVGLATWSQEVAGPGRGQPAARAEVPRPGKARWEYKALGRLDLAEMAAKPPAGAVKRPPGEVFRQAANPEVLSLGLNNLADQGWELVAIEPHYQLKDSEGGGYNIGPTYVFKRPKSE